MGTYQDKEHINAISNETKGATNDNRARHRIRQSI